MTVDRRAFLALTAAAAVPLSAPAFAQAYPARPINFIVPFPAGGLTDVLARVVGAELGKSLGQTVIIENRAGAGGNIGMQAVARAPADGYTIGMAITSHAINMSLMKSPGYDIVRDFVPVRLLVMSTNVLAIHPSIPANTLRELIDLAKAKKIQLSYSSSGVGTTPHLSGEMFKHMTGIAMTHVPYKGAAPAIADLLAGHVQMSFNSVSEQLQNVRTGKLRALAVTSATRSPLLPDVPTVAEAANLPDYVIDGWLGVVAPAQTPRPIVDLLSARIAEIMQKPDIKERLETSMAVNVVNLPPEGFAKFLSGEVEKWTKVVKLSGAKVD